MTPGEPTADAVRELIAQLLPGADPDRLVRALMAEREAAPAAAGSHGHSDEQVAAHELNRVRSQFVLGGSARTLEHAFNNLLTALLAEAQLLELEALPDEHRAAVSRMLDLTRRLVILSRKLGATEPGGAKN